MLRARGQTGPEAKILASALTSSICTRPGLGLNLPSKCKYILVVSILWLYHCNIHYKDVVKHSNVGHSFTYMFLPLSPCVTIDKWLHVAGLDLEDLASVLALWFWPRPRFQEFRPKCFVYSLSFYLCNLCFFLFFFFLFCLLLFSTVTGVYITTCQIWSHYVKPWGISHKWTVKYIYFHFAGLSD